MEERRKSKRTPLNSKILVKKLGGNDTHEEVSVNVVNVSKTGIGFNCEEPLEIGAVYEAYLTIWTSEIIHCFIEIVRIEKLPDTFNYGGLFIGMPEFELQRIDVYNVVADADKYRSQK